MMRGIERAAAALMVLAGTAAGACPSNAELTAQDLVGLWRAQFEGGPQAASLLLEPHREFAGSLSGAINRNGTQAPLAGDLDEGLLTLEESSDGVRISATWVGAPVEGGCGREIRGTWQTAPQGKPHPFVLRRIGAW